LLKNNYNYALSTPLPCNLTNFPSSSRTGIANSGVSSIYFAPNAHIANLNPQAPAAGLQMANALLVRLVASVTFASAPYLPPVAMQGHVMPPSPHTLAGLGPFANLDCMIIFTKTEVSVIHPKGHCILKGWQDPTVLVSGDSHFNPTSQACQHQRCLPIMRIWAHVEVLPIFLQQHSVNPNQMINTLPPAIPSPVPPSTSAAMSCVDQLHPFH
jgi:hypothetical protein